MTNINNIFDQFTPVYLRVFSLTLVGSFIALIWVTLNKTSHTLPVRAYKINFVLKTASQKILPQTKGPWTKVIMPIFFLCLTYNLVSLIPYTFSQTSHLRFTFRISLPIWLTLKVMGIIKKWKRKVAHLVPQGTPPLLIPPMILIELVSLCIQPLTLGFRLGAKILAGHLLIFLCSCVVWTSVSASPLGFLSFLLLFLLFILEIAVACIQAAVFTILANQYLEENKG